ncbi:hypothetical protein NLI96_g6442 [Meripilus lineatus]|uniref:AB hydrolase-1 domain-containing protein n=1 Tax=Meripilus lineatus TaxID=2056292 RepID=A0AAD5V120_9APHY|nr:hypothetical protein NLI96_g6442 [Physisporinus lineatus]
MTQLSDDEKYLQLPGDRQLAYAESGYTDSLDVIIFFHGAFGIGTAHKYRSPPPVFEEKRVHYVAPTLPGWGKSSPTPKSQSFREYLYEVITTLIHHLHPDTTGLRLYISGGSFGSVVSQILYGAPYDLFPLGRQIAGLLLLAPFSSPRVHKEFNKSLSWTNWMGIGSVSRILPGNLSLRLGSMMMKRNVSTPERARAFVHDFVVKDMSQKERVVYDRWRKEKQLTEDQVEEDLADGVYRSVEKSWEGFHAISDVIHSDWGFNPLTLDAEHTKSPVYVVMTREDKETLLLGEWIVENYQNAQGRYEEGGHNGSMFVMDDIWADFLSRCSV